MKFVSPLTEVVSEEYDGITYSFKYYKSPTSVSGIDDEAYDVWDGTIEKDTGEFIIVGPLKRIYKSAIDANSSYPPANLDTWVDWGTTNSNRMFALDEQIGEASVGTDAELVFDFSKSDTLAGIGLQFQTARIVHRDADDNIIFDEEVDGKDIGCLSFSEYFYTDAKIKNRIVMSDFEWLPTSTMTITFTGDVTIETLVYGISEELGITLRGTSLSLESESRIKTDEFTGFREVLRFGKVRILDVRLEFNTSEFDTIAAVANRVIDKNILWIPDSGDKFTELITLGYIEDFKIPIENMEKINTSSRIIGVVTND